MRVCPHCGNNHFMAHQVVRMDVMVDGDNNFEDAGEIYDSEKPYGPYTCTKCNREYDDLAELKRIYIY